jgi:hypothetical protein
VDGLANSHSIEASKRQGFIHDVFYNFEELIVISRELFDDLANLSYRYEGQCVPMIGDILVKHFAFFEQPFVKYSPHAQLSKYLAELEIKHNPEFDKFVKDVPSHKRTNRLPFWNYLLCPVTRMQRYPLLLSTLIKKTEDSHPDFDYLTRANDMICTIAKKADVSAASVKKRLAILGIRDSITFKQGELYDLQLSDNARILYHRGGLKRRNTELVDKHDIYGFVFDHMLILTKARKTNTGEEYRIWRRPIPLHLLKVQSASGNIRVQPSGTANSYVFPAGATTLVLQHLGQKDAVYHFYCQSLEEKQIWMKAIDDARATLRKRQGDMDIFDLRPLDDVNFRYSGASSTSTRVNCSVPFVTIRHERKTAIGTDTGVFFKTEGQDSTVRRIIQCESVVQMAVMEKYNILVVLTGK